MPSRYNRHIGRDMTYPYDASPPDRQVAYIFDTNKCIECQTCTVACKTCWTSGKGQETIFWNNVETKPYGGYPIQWDLRLLEKLEPAEWNGDRLSTSTIFEIDGEKKPPLGHRPVVEDYAAPNLGEDDVSGNVSGGTAFGGIHPMWMFYLARICNHCVHPACLAACPRKAIYKRQEDGIVLVDQERCRGYQECVRACPYKKVFYNMVSRASEKCIGCFPRVENGMVALCVESCIGKIRMHGFLTTQAEPREDNPLDYIIKIRKLALPLYPQAGTGPNVYYIPPLHVPTGFLEQLFGPEVERSKKMYRELASDPKLLGALLLFGSTNRIIHRYEVQGEEAVGWDEHGEEVSRVPFQEPVYIREHYDRARSVYRHNTT
ncbi:MAG: dehydrogenase [Candidatus Eisenbacteria bacterium]|uniref:Dehydrogenase n=1 Tax=Eiseniibacteriota bacterium TaxID=2212470 RepID=A0A956RR33_UNCEI|nr:dehydrogenase [Candidatus Eisenbacteria bacterium]